MKISGLRYLIPYLAIALVAGVLLGAQGDTIRPVVMGNLIGLAALSLARLMNRIPQFRLMGRSAISRAEISGAIAWLSVFSLWMTTVPLADLVAPGLLDGIGPGSIIHVFLFVFGISRLMDIAARHALIAAHYGFRYQGK